MSDSGSKVLEYVLKTVTILCGVGLVFLGIIELINYDFDGFRGFFLDVYYVLFGILLCLSELPCDGIISCFFFLKFYFGKFLFCLFLATITFTLDPIYFLIISVALFCASILYLILSLSSKKDFSGAAEKESKPIKREEYTEV
jgi:hypothetical protein